MVMTVLNFSSRKRETWVRGERKTEECKASHLIHHIHSHPIAQPTTTRAIHLINCTHPIVHHPNPIPRTRDRPAPCG